MKAAGCVAFRRYTASSTAVFAGLVLADKAGDVVLDGNRPGVEDVAEPANPNLRKLHAALPTPP
jgi:hypothetical protein